MGLGHFSESGEFIGDRITNGFQFVEFKSATKEEPASCHVRWKGLAADEARELTMAHSALRVVNDGSALFRGTVVPAGCDFYEDEAGGWRAKVKAVGLLGGDPAGIGSKWRPVTPTPEPGRTRLAELGSRIDGVVLDQSAMNLSWRVHQIEKAVCGLVGLKPPEGREGIDAAAVDASETEAAQVFVDRILAEVDKRIAPPEADNERREEPRGDGGVEDVDAAIRTLKNLRGSYRGRQVDVADALEHAMKCLGSSWTADDEDRAGEGRS